MSDMSEQGDLPEFELPEILQGIQTVEEFDQLIKEMLEQAKSLTKERQRTVIMPGPGLQIKAIQGHCKDCVWWDTDSRNPMVRGLELTGQRGECTLICFIDGHAARPDTNPLAWPGFLEDGVDSLVTHAEFGCVHFQDKQDFTEDERKCMQNSYHPYTPVQWKQDEEQDNQDNQKG